SRQGERGAENEGRLRPEKGSDLAQSCAKCGHRGELLSTLCERDRDEERHCRSGESECEALLDAADTAEVDSRDRADRLGGLPADVLDERSLCTSPRSDVSRHCDRVTGRLDKEHIGARLVCRTLEIREVRDHERVAWRGGELLDDTDDVEGHDLEAA